MMLPLSFSLLMTQYLCLDGALNIQIWLTLLNYSEFLWNSLCSCFGNISLRTVWWIQKVNIGWMMVLFISHSSSLSSYALVGILMNRNVSSYWSIQKCLYKSLCGCSMNLYPNIIGLSDGFRKWMLVEWWYYLFLTPHD